MKKVLVSLFSMMLIFTGCGSSASNDKNSSSCEKTIYMVTDIGGINDESFNQGTWEGVERSVEENDGVCAENIVTTNDSDYIPNLTSATEKDPIIVIAAGYLFQEAMVEVANNNPDQQYLLIDSLVQGEDGKQLPNVASAVFSEEQGSFVAGVAAGITAKENGYDKLGFIGGMEGDLIIKFEVGFIAGVKSVLPNATVEVAYTGSFQDSAKGKVEASKMYNNGVKIIYQAAGASGNGVIQEAQERYISFQKGDLPDQVWAVGVDRDQYSVGLVKDTDHSVVLTSMVKKVDVAANDVSNKTIAGDKQGGNVLVYNLENDGVGIPAENPNLSADAVAAVEDAKAKIIAGEIVVPATR